MRSGMENRECCLRMEYIVYFYREFHIKLGFTVYFYCSNREEIILHVPPVFFVI